VVAAAVRRPGKYNRVQPAPRSDSASAREGWFRRCLELIGELPPPQRPTSLAFPYEIGCGLAGGEWARFDAMISAFAASNPDIRVIIARWTGGGAGGGGGRGRTGGRGGGRGGR
jgi:hypothetical protein